MAIIFMRNLTLLINFLMLRDDNGRNVIYLKNEQSGKHYAVYTSDIDTGIIMGGIKMEDEETINRIALKYYTMVTEDKSLNVNIFYNDEETTQLAKKIEEVKIFKSKERKIFCMVQVNGERLEPREITNDQWQRLWLADDMKGFKLRLGARLFKDVLSVEEKKPQTTTPMENTTENKPKIAVSPILKQFLDLKKKHPDVLLFFRCGDFYETYKDDAKIASRILGITLTKSLRTKDDEGKPLAMAGFPYHALATYLPKLLRAGKRVAFCRPDRSS